MTDPRTIGSAQETLGVSALCQSIANACICLSYHLQASRRCTALLQLARPRLACSPETLGIKDPRHAQLWIVLFGYRQQQLTGSTFRNPV